MNDWRADRLAPAASVPIHFAAALEALKIPICSNTRVSGILHSYNYVVTAAQGGYAWFAPLACEEFYTRWVKKDLGDVTFRTMCMLAAEAYKAEAEGIPKVTPLSWKALK